MLSFALGHVLHGSWESGPHKARKKGAADEALRPAKGLGRSKDDPTKQHIEALQTKTRQSYRERERERETPPERAAHANEKS